MLLTEDEARAKTCPMAQVAVGPSGDVYLAPVGQDCKCIASNCQAWRWKKMLLGHDLEYQIKESGEEQGRKQWEEFCKDDPLEGYCGLAGRPS